MTIPARWLVFLVGAALILGVMGGDATGGVPKPDGDKDETPAEKIRKALDQNHSIDFQGLTLEAALESLREQSKINIVLDRQNLLHLEISPDEIPVTLKLSQTKLRTILKAMLGQYQLTHVIYQESLLITTEQAAVDRQVRQHVSIDFDKMPLDKALKQLARETGTNVILDPRHISKIKDPVSLKLDDVPLEVAVRLMAELSGLRSVRQANVLFVTCREVAGELKKEEETAKPPQDYQVTLERLIQILR